MRKKKINKLIFPTFPSAFHQLTPVHLKDFLKVAAEKFALLEAKRDFQFPLPQSLLSQYSC